MLTTAGHIPRGRAQKQRDFHHKSGSYKVKNYHRPLGLGCHTFLQASQHDTCWGHQWKSNSLPTTSHILHVATICFQFFYLLLIGLKVKGPDDNIDKEVVQ